MKIRPIHAASLFPLLAAAALTGCDTNQSSPPRDEKGQIVLPAGIRESQQEERAKFLEQEKKSGPRGRR